MRYIIVPVVVLLAAAWIASADTIYMKDGSTREGRVLSETDDAVVLDMVVGGANARITVNKNDIDRIEVKATGQEVLQDEYKARLGKLDKTNADAVVELARWCSSKKLFTEAEGLLKGLAAQGPDKFIRANVALGEMEFDRKRFDVARGYLKVVLDKEPGNLDAKIVMDAMTRDENDAFQKLLTDAVDLYGHDKFEQALAKAESFHSRATPENSKLLLGKVAFPNGMTFDDFIASARLRIPCPFCKEGARVCPVCKGKGELADGAVCSECGAAGTVVCDHCGGTGVKLGDAPDWELAPMARVLEQWAAQDAQELQKIAQSLAGTLKDEDLTAAGFKAQVLAGRALRWLDQLDAIGKKKIDFTLRSFTRDREDVQARFQGLCVQLGQLFGKRGEDSWARTETADSGLLAQDKAVRGARDDLARAVYLYGHARLKPRDPYPPLIAGAADKDQKLLAKLNLVVEHNVKLLKAYDLALANFRRNDLGSTLAVQVDLVNHAARQDLDFLSQRTTKEINWTLADWMAGCRFELGKQKGNFGDTTEYERPAFIKRLLGEADAMAAKADTGYQQMLNAAGNGRRNMVSAGLVHDTRIQAEAARLYDRAVLVVPYPLSGDKRQQINDQIAYMSKIIDQCNQWFTVPQPGPTPGPNPIPH
jgi:hypothetical protein